MVLECQQHPDYYQAIETLLNLAEEYGSHANRLARGGTGTVKDARSNLVQAETDLKVCRAHGIQQLTITDHVTTDPD